MDVKTVSVCESIKLTENKVYLGTFTFAANSPSQAMLWPLVLVLSWCKRSPLCLQCDLWVKGRLHVQGSDCSILGNVTRICCSVPVFLSFFHPIPPAFHWICCSTFDCNGICESREGCIRSKGLIESLGEKPFNFMLSSLGFLCFFHPTPLHFVVQYRIFMLFSPQPTAFHWIRCNALHYVAMGFVGQDKLHVQQGFDLSSWGKRLFNFIKSGTEKIRDQL